MWPRIVSTVPFTLSRKLRFGITLIFVVLLIVSVLSFYALHRVHHENQRLVQQTLEVMRLLEQLKMSGFRIIASSTKYVLVIQNKPQTNVSTWRARLQRERDVVNQGVARFREISSRYQRLIDAFFPNESDHVERIQATGEMLIEQSLRLVEETTLTVSSSPISVEMSRIEQAETLLLDAIDDALAHEEDERTERAGNIEAVLLLQQQANLVGLVLALVVVFILGRHIKHRFVMPLETLKGAVDNFSKGRPAKFIECGGDAEIVSLAESFENMVMRLSESDLARQKAHRQLEQANEELQQYRGHLEQLVAARTADLESSNRELESYSYSLAHDLRTPLRAITSFSQILLEEARDKLDEQDIDGLKRVVVAGKYMAKLIDDILELSRITRREMRVATVDMGALVERFATDLEKQAPERSIDWVIQPDVNVKGDPVLLAVMLRNLIDNAWKYTKHAPAARIEFRSVLRGGELICFVKDNGVGFDMRYVDTLFKPFHRLHDTQEFAGTGIGLAAVARVLQRHGGRFWAESKINGGATFFLALPKQKTETEAKVA